MTNAGADAAETTVIPVSAQAGLMTAIVFLTYMGQMILNPIIAPLSREMGLREWHVGATISLAAIVLASFSAYWGRASQRLGVKRVLVTGMLIAVVALSAFSVISSLGVNRILTGFSLIIAVMVTRGLLYGAGISAVAPTAQAHLVTHIDSEVGRVKALGMIGAAQGIASVVGGIFGGILAALGGLLLPLAVMPAVMLIGIFVLIFKFRPQEGTQLIKRPKHIRFTDPRIRPWLIGGLFMFLVFLH
ncbi:MFS transporter [Arcanobacterium hippocoleae]